MGANLLAYRRATGLYKWLGPDQTGRLFFLEKATGRVMGQNRRGNSLVPTKYQIIGGDDKGFMLYDTKTGEFYTQRSNGMGKEIMPAGAVDDGIIYVGGRKMEVSS